jgi:hypothetical protein
MWLRSHSESSMMVDRCHQLMTALSFFPWSGNNTTVGDITSLLSSSSPQSYLSSVHINHMVGRMSNQYQELYGPGISERHVFACVETLETIVKFYGSQRAPVKSGNLLWEKLAEIENQIVRGEVDSVGGVHHLPAHWVSVVFDIRQSSILYGDSLDRPIPRLERNAFTQWIQRLNQRSGRVIDADSILVHPLPTGHQRDSISCGLFALNAIGHYYLDHQLLSTDKTLVSGRMDIALDLLHGNMVCHLLSAILCSTQYILQTAETEGDTIITDFSFLHSSPLIQPLQNITPQSSPQKHTSHPPPLIILDDYSINHTLQDPTKDHSKPSTPPGTPLTGTLVFHHPNCSTSSNSDSEMFYPPSSGIPSEASSAVVSESDLPSAIVSESDLPPPSHLQPPAPKKQTGIYDFFQALSEDEIQAAQAKRKRANSEAEEAD